MQIVDADVFFGCQDKMDYVPFDQSVGWHNYRKQLKSGRGDGGYKIIYFIDDINEPKICAWGMIYVFPVFGKILRIVGKSYKNDLFKTNIKDFYEQISFYSRGKFSLIQVSSSDIYNVNYEIGIRLAGFVRPMVLSGCPLSIVINLKDEKWVVSRIWKRNVKMAEKSNLRFVHISSPTIENVEVFCKMFSEMADYKKLAFNLLLENISILLKNNQFKLFFVETIDGRSLASRIVYLYNNTSYDIFAANSNLSREVRGSTYFLLNSIFDWLGKNGIEYFDFGGIGPGKGSANSVYEFKTFSGGTEVSCNGEWVYSNNKLLERLFYLLLSFRGNCY
jgi:hypothetical protein